MQFALTKTETAALSDILASDCDALTRKMAETTLKMGKKASLRWNRGLANFVVTSLMLDPEGRNKSPRGQACTFLKKSGIGIKCYTSEHSAKIARANQIKGEEAGIAPLTGQAFKISLRIGSSYLEIFGYLTEIAKVVEDDYTLTDEFQYGNEAHDALVDTMRENGLNTNDLHSGNVGKIDGRFVCIDFDSVSVGGDY